MIRKRTNREKIGLHNCRIIDSQRQRRYMIWAEKDYIVKGGAYNLCNSVDISTGRVL